MIMLFWDFKWSTNGPKDVTDETDSSRYENETHMLKVLEVILNKCHIISWAFKMEKARPLKGF